MRPTITIASGTAIAVALGATAVRAQDDAPTLPSTLAWTTFDVGSTGYVQSIAIGKALQDAFGTQLRVMAMATDQSRLAPARDGRVPYALSGTDTFYAFEGVQSYAAPGWGPQDIAAVSIVGNDSCVALAVPADEGIETIADLKGHPVANVVGSPALQANMRAFLAFGGLTTDDVELVDMPSFGGAWQALINGQIDAHTSLTSGALSEQGAAGARGLYWIPMPHDDDEGWARVQAVNPHFTRHVGTLGPNLPEGGLECAGVPYPVLVTYTRDEDLDYNILKAVDQQVDTIATAEPAASGWAADRQIANWVLPYSDGAIRYLTEQGAWSDELQAHNDKLRERQQVLLDAWSEMDGADAEGFAEKWGKVRAAALEEAGFDPYFR